MQSVPAITPIMHSNSIGGYCATWQFSVDIESLALYSIYPVQIGVIKNGQTFDNIIIDYMFVYIIFTHLWLADHCS